MTAVELSEGSDLAEYEALFLGRRIVAAETGSFPMPPKYYGTASGRLTLDDGTQVLVSPNEGGCSCGAGDYELAHLATVDNIITAVRLEDDSTGDGVSRYDEVTKEYETGHYSIFVVADAQEINVARIEGDDGNGYYGTGYRLVVVKP